MAKKRKVETLEMLRDWGVAAFQASEKSPIIASWLSTLFPYGIIRILDSGNTGFNSPRRQSEAMTNELFQIANKMEQPSIVTPLFSIGHRQAVLPAAPTMDLDKVIGLLLKRKSQG